MDYQKIMLMVNKVQITTWSLLITLI